jgi:hypothetical protein
MEGVCRPRGNRCVTSPGNSGARLSRLHAIQRKPPTCFSPAHAFRGHRLSVGTGFRWAQAFQPLREPLLRSHRSPTTSHQRKKRLCQRTKKPAGPNQGALGHCGHVCSRMRIETVIREWGGCQGSPPANLRDATPLAGTATTHQITSFRHRVVRKPHANKNAGFRNRRNRRGACRDPSLLSIPQNGP